MGSVKCPHCGEICSQCEAHSDAAVFQRGRPAREVALWKSHAAKRKAVIKIFESKFNRVLFDARAETLRKIEAHYKPEAKAVTRAAGDFMFDGEKFKKALVSVMRQATQRALDQAGTELMQELGKNDPWKYPPQKAVEVLAQRENKMKGVADDVFERIKEQITQGITDGDSIEGMANRIKDTFNDISDGKARVVASTETSAAYGAARDEAMKDAGVRWKQWLTSGLPNVRAAHAAANGQTVPVDEPFHVGGEDLEYPGDPSGEPGNVINCHCVSVAAQEPN
jgi:SPP1 gp7 family putative phage head morphogenesis protein